MLPRQGQRRIARSSSAPLGRSFGSDVFHGFAALTRGYNPQPLRGLAGLATKRTSMPDWGFMVGYYASRPIATSRRWHSRARLASPQSREST